MALFFQMSAKCLSSSACPSSLSQPGPCGAVPRTPKTQGGHHTTSCPRSNQQVQAPLEGHVTHHTFLLKKIQWPSLILNSSPRLPSLRRELSSLAHVHHSTLPEYLGLSDACSHSLSILGPFYFQNWRKHAPSTPVLATLPSPAAAFAPLSMT